MTNTPAAAPVPESSVEVVLLLARSSDNLGQVLPLLERIASATVMVETREAALVTLEQQRVGLVLADLELTGRPRPFLEAVGRRLPGVPVIFLDPAPSVRTAVAALRAGAFGYLPRPVSSERMEMLLGRALRLPPRPVAETPTTGLAPMVGRSTAWLRILERIQTVAPTNASVLLLGESGTGKELVARAIHHQSRRAARSLVKVNCVALAPGVFESELFGHERGAFTDAHDLRQGRFEQAHRGTLFLDEIGDLSLPIQLKLLGAIQDRKIERVGGQRPIEIDVRLIAATNRNLVEAMAEGAFREELYYRLKVVTIEIPPLRERAVDVPVLLQHFLAAFSAAYGRACRFSPEAWKRACDYHWPGNVRELRNCVEAATVTARGNRIELSDLPPPVGEGQAGRVVEVSLGDPLKKVEHRYILATLERAGGNKSLAAKLLGISKNTLNKRLRTLEQLSATGADGE